MKETVGQLLLQMLDLQLLEEDGGKVRLTLLGRACGGSSLSFPSAMRLVGLLRELREAVSAESLMVIVQGLPEMDDVYTPVMKRGQAESRWPGEATRRFGPALARLLQRNAADNWAYYARCKRTMILHQFISGVPLAAIEEDTTTNAFQGKIGAGNIRNIADTTRFHLNSSWKIATLLLLGDSLSEERIDALLKQLEFGVPERALGLLELPMRLLRGEHLALHTAGLFTVEAVWNAQPVQLRALLSPSRYAVLDSYRRTAE